MLFFDEINDTDLITAARRYVLEVPFFDEIIDPENAFFDETNDNDLIIIFRM